MTPKETLTARLTTLRESVGLFQVPEAPGELFLSFNDVCRELQLCPHCLASYLHDYVNQIVITTSVDTHITIFVVHPTVIFQLFMDGGMTSTPLEEIRALYKQAYPDTPEDLPDATGDEDDIVKKMIGL